MPNPSALLPRWTLIRGARQLLTLRGDAGPRRGRAMNKLEVIANGAILIRNDVIECVGPAPRIENLAAARKAVEINASGKIILPAFVEADGAILHSGAVENADMPHNLRTSSRKKLTWTGIANSSEYTRHGTLTAGFAALFSDDLRTALKVLQTLQALQGKPMRIRPIFSACSAKSGGSSRDAQSVQRVIEPLIEKWLPAIKARKLASIVEIESQCQKHGLPFAAIRALALGAANSQFALRIRALENLSEEIMELALEAGATALLSHPRAELLEATSLLRSNTVIALPASGQRAGGRDGGRDGGRAGGNDPEEGASFVRRLLDAGAPLALCMGIPTENDFTRNMQHALYIACRYFQMTPEEAITAATFNAAYSLRAAHATGSLEPGKCADLLLMDVPDYRELVRRPGMSDVELTMRAGHVVYRRQPLILD